ncbi:AraC-type DNA-binding protein [Natronincola peptidivorans]|uniref:AraC-type DNA-binding protein n=1 Tax=Natronincola peptidivorans TaxID=426128 RepID=A0A1I0FUY7_9FIRM|nr:helix-turn-helix transcriptional regulator [Natronincola peptidivorans]SET61386.1 AraC-type DNA-binding protein [Natronincola peptidivorans]
MREKLIDKVLHGRLGTENQIFVAPCEALKRYVAKYTITFESRGVASDTLTLIPDASGCLIFTFNGAAFTSLLWGTTTKTSIVKNDLNDHPMQLFIEFLPGGLYFLTGINQSDLANRQIPLTQINSQLHSLILDVFEGAKNLNDFIDRVNRVLLSYIQKRPYPQVLLSVLESIKGSKGCLSVKELAEIQRYSQRHLNRIANDYLGASLKTVSNIIRIQNVLLEMSGGDCSYTDIGQVSGFYDQAHFIHTFKSICGKSPKEFMKTCPNFTMNSSIFDIY